MPPLLTVASVATNPYEIDRTALLIVDPDDDVMSEGGKLYARTRETANAVGFDDNMRMLISSVRRRGLQVVVVPHHRSRGDDYRGWRHMTHWAQNSFANTDLDAQVTQHGILNLILVGMIANTCIESTGRFGMELGYHVTLVRDATAAFSHEGMHAAFELNGPTFAHAIVTARELLARLPAPASS